jgi:hypothetical protein
MSAATTRANPNPIDWKIATSFFDFEGRDIPLRYGQHDAGPVDGFGYRHIQDGHQIDVTALTGLVDSTLKTDTSPSPTRRTVRGGHLPPTPSGTGSSSSTPNVSTLLPGTAAQSA